MCPDCEYWKQQAWAALTRFEQLVAARDAREQWLLRLFTAHMKATDHDPQTRCPALPPIRRSPLHTKEQRAYFERLLPNDERNGRPHEQESAP